MSIKERIAAVLGVHRQSQGCGCELEDVCLCGWSPAAGDDCFSGHVASVLVAELGLTAEYRQHPEGGTTLPGGFELAPISQRHVTAWELP